jgi:hypothetical protein
LGLLLARRAVCNFAARFACGRFIPLRELEPQNTALPNRLCAENFLKPALNSFELFEFYIVILHFDF